MLARAPARRGTRGARRAYRMRTPAVPDRARWLTTAAIVAATCALAVALELHGTGSRRWYEDAAGRIGRPTWVEVPDATAALARWNDAGVSGRRLLLLTGRWATVPLTALDPMPRSPSNVDEDTALFLAARDGIVREIEVVMPAGALAQRRAEARSAKTFAVTRRGFRQDFHGFSRQFAPVSAPPAPSDEPFLVLAEPSFFAEDAPIDLPRWLADHGIRYDLAILAGSDPVAPQEALARAAVLAGALRGGR